MADLKSRMGRARANGFWKTVPQGINLGTERLNVSFEFRIWEENEKRVSGITFMIWMSRGLAGKEKQDQNRAGTTLQGHQLASGENEETPDWPPEAKFQ